MTHRTWRGQNNPVVPPYLPHRPDEWGSVEGREDTNQGMMEGKSARTPEKGDEMIFSHRGKGASHRHTEAIVWGHHRIHSWR
jgi:hypothetical protein